MSTKSIELDASELAIVTGGDDLANAYANNAMEGLQGIGQLIGMRQTAEFSPLGYIGALSFAVGYTVGSAIGFWSVTAYNAIKS